MQNSVQSKKEKKPNMAENRVPVRKYLKEKKKGKKDGYIGS